MLQVNAKQTSAAEESYKKAISLDPKSPTPSMALGAFYAGQRRFPEAEEQFRHAIELDPNEPRLAPETWRVFTWPMGKKMMRWKC